MANFLADILQLTIRAAPEEHGLRVLVVEENVLQQTMLSLLLKQLGHTVGLASDGFEALSRIQREPAYDVILMECQMAMMDGIQLTKFIRELETLTGQATTIVGIGSSGLSGLSERYFAAGMNDYLSKPLNKLTLKAVLGHRVRQNKGSTKRRPHSFNLSPFPEHHTYIGACLKAQAGARMVALESPTCEAVESGVSALSPI
ncbi:MAG: response regulator [Candidatus Obscuribacterales bacterium]|nr:response regulator [Candidatus Obscuribacterales bacterium]